MTFQRIEVTFDRYRPESIKAGTRTKRKQRKRPVRRQIERESVPLQSDGSNFMALEDNKVDLSLLLSNNLVDHSPSDQTMVVAGGFSEVTIVKSSDEGERERKKVFVCEREIERKKTDDRRKGVLFLCA